MEDDQNGRRPKWKTIKLEQKNWKMTKIEDDSNGRRTKWKTTQMEDDQNGRQAKWKTTKMEQQPTFWEFFCREQIIFRTSLKSIPSVAL